METDSQEYLQSDIVVALAVNMIAVLRLRTSASATWQRFFRNGGSCILHFFVRSYTDRVYSRRRHETNLRTHSVLTTRVGIAQSL